MPFLRRSDCLEVLARRKPLLLLGARQVGKTYLVREFGANELRRIHLFNFEAEADLVKSF